MAARLASVFTRVIPRRGGERVRSEMEEPLLRGSKAAALALALLLVSLPVLASYVFLVVTSFADIVVFTPFIDYRAVHFSLDNYRLFFEGRLNPTSTTIYSTKEILMMILNTVIVAAGVTAVVVGASVPAAYAISRMNFRGRAALMRLLMLLHAFPGVALIIAVYFIFIYLRSPLYHLLERLPEGGVSEFLQTHYDVVYSFLFVILARASLEIPMSIWLMKGFFDRVPWELEWSALVDGASRFTAFRKVVLPLVKPGIAALAIFAFLAGWEDLIYVYVFLPKLTLATYIHYVAVGNIETSYLPVVAAAAVIYLLPTIAFFVTTQRLLLETMGGGLKG